MVGRFVSGFFSFIRNRRLTDMVGGVLIVVGGIGTLVCGFVDVGALGDVFLSILCVGLLPFFLRLVVR